MSKYKGLLWSASKQELAVLDSDEERKKAVKEARRRLGWDWRWWAAIPLFVFGSEIVVVIIPHWLFDRAGLRGTLPHRIFEWVDTFVFALVFVLAPAWLYRNLARKKLRQYLVGQGYKVCLGCGYDLRGQTEARCPECGRPFALR